MLHQHAYPLVLGYAIPIPWHHKLDEQIQEELHRPHPDDIALAELKKRKLRLKEEIERLRHSLH
ncbi:MAG: DUF465 domain-containing protein [Alphaproteobacteria bacterium]|nr:DUF465 domain-containing protein [Alphaproteobacteria bacterium]